MRYNLLSVASQALYRTIFGIYWILISRYMIYSALLVQLLCLTVQSLAAGDRGQRACTARRDGASEIDLIMPLNPGAQFDGHWADWLAHEHCSAHHPTVMQGRALICICSQAVRSSSQRLER
jgi:hypothetical protein